MTLGMRPSPGSEHHGACGISANAKRGDGFVLAQYAARIEHCRSQHPHILDQRGATLALQPATRSVSSGSPACGTASFQSRVVFHQHDFPFVPPRKHSRAIASAGKTCPPCRRLQSAISLDWPAPQASAARCEIFNRTPVPSSMTSKTRSAIADERQRNPFGRDNSVAPRRSIMRWHNTSQ